MQGGSRPDAPRLTGRRHRRIGALDDPAVALVIGGEPVSLGLEGDQLGSQRHELPQAPVDVGHLGIEDLEHVIAGGAPRAL